jgi:transcriptional antiterminator NusG
VTEAEGHVAEEQSGDAFRWYALQTYSGHEKKVKTLLERKIQELEGEPDEKAIREVIVPTQEVVEIKGGKRIKSTKRLYPGYVLIQMRMDQHTAFIVNSVPGVIKFVGGGEEPQPLKPEEINKILGIADELEDAGPEQEIPFRPGQVVEVTEGPFSDFSGTVEEVFAEKGKVRVQVSLFGRPTSVELDYTQLQGF